MRKKNGKPAILNKQAFALNSSKFFCVLDMIRDASQKNSIFHFKNRHRKSDACFGDGNDPYKKEPMQEGSFLKRVTYRRGTRSGTVVRIRIVDPVRIEPELAVVEVPVRCVGEITIGLRSLIVSIPLSEPTG